MEKAQGQHDAISIRHGTFLRQWTWEAAIYAVNFHLVDALPPSVLESWNLERQDIIRAARELNRPLSPGDEKRLDDLCSEKLDAYLDAGAGECWMKRDKVAELVAGALQQFDGARYRLHAWCVMPNHVHTVVQPLSEFELSDIVHSWKSLTAPEANSLLGRTGPFWQAEPYDHLVRDENDLRRQVEYVLANPARAGLKDWRWVGVGRAPRP
jgi:REP element-mobilizing transposase RayT